MSDNLEKQILEALHDNCKKLVLISGCHPEIGKLALKLSNNNFEQAMRFLGYIPDGTYIPDNDEENIQTYVSNLRHKENLESLSDIKFYIKDNIDDGDTEIILDFDKLTDERYKKLNPETKQLLKQWLIKKNFNIDFEYGSNSWKITV